MLKAFGVVSLFNQSIDEKVFFISIFSEAISSKIQKKNLQIHAN